MASRLGRLRTSFRRTPSIPAAFSRAAAPGSKLHMQLHSFNTLPKPKMRLPKIRPGGSKPAPRPVRAALMGGGALIVSGGIRGYRHDAKLRASGYSNKQILKARQTSRNGRISMMAGTYLATTNAGNAAISHHLRQKKVLTANILGAAAGAALYHHGLSRNMAQAEKKLAKVKPDGKPTTGKKRSGISLNRAHMSRSQAASVAAKARWHGKGRKK